MKNTGIYIVQLKNEELMPVTRDRRYVDTCAKVNRDNIKVGKAESFTGRKLGYYKDFDEANVVFQPIAELDNIKTAERVVLRALKQYRKLSPKQGKLEWLEGISYADAKRIALAALDGEGIDYTPVINKVF
jgi:hypothetical protein